MKRRISAIILALCLALTLMPTAAFAEGGTTPDLVIDSVEDFKAFFENCSAYDGKTVALGCDIDLDGVALSLGSNSFKGTFDGKNHTIGNFTITAPLFNGHLRIGSVVKDLTVENVTLNNTADGQQRLGIICRNLNGTLENVKVKDCTIQSEALLGVVGGLAAMTQDDSKAETCSVENLTVKANGGAVAIGGAFGLLTGNENTVVNNVTATNTSITFNVGSNDEISVGEVWGRRQGSVSDDKLTAYSGNITTLSTGNAVAEIATSEGYNFYFDSLQDAFDAADSDDTIILLGNITVDGTDVVSIPASTNGNGDYFNGGIFNVYDKSVTFDLNGHSITYNGHKDITWSKWTKNSCIVAHGLFLANNGGKLTIEDSKGTGTVTVYGMASGVYACSPNSVITVKGGTWVNEGCAECHETNLFLYASHGGELSITGGSFEQALNGDGDSYLIVEHGGAYKNAVIDYSKTKITVSGGTFINMDPAKAVQVLQNEDNTQTWGNTDVVADGYIVKKDGNTYTVVAKNGLRSGVYTSDPTGYLASNYYISKTDAQNGLWTVSKHSSSSGGSGSSTKYTIIVEDAENGVVTANRKSAEAGDTVTLTVTPDSGYTLETITVTDRKGAEVKLTAKNGKYTFKMPAGKVTVTATFMDDNSMLNFFVDVPADQYYYDAVLWAAKNGITGGVDDVHFAPDRSCTRAQAVTFLWRAAGSPEPQTSVMPFTDVPADLYYYKAVLWAVENGITNGTTDTTFSPDRTCTRAQIVAFLFRYAASQGMDAVTLQELVSGYSDAASVPGYALSAFNWALAGGIVTGNNGVLLPNNDCTRAQIVTFLYRLLGK